MALDIQYHEDKFAPAQGGQYTIPWRYLATSDHVVELQDVAGVRTRTLQLGLDYTISPEGDTPENVGVMTLTATPEAVEVQLRVVHTTPAIQPVEAEKGSESIVQQLDRTALILQQLTDQVTRVNSDTVLAAAQEATAAAAAAAAYGNPEFDSPQDLLADTTLTYLAGNPGSVVPGDKIRVGHHVVTIKNALDMSDRATAGGVLWDLDPDRTGYHDVLGLGFSTDGENNMNGLPVGWNVNTRTLLPSGVEHVPGTSYLEGDAIQDQVSGRAKLCITPHVAGASVAADAANWTDGAYSGTDNFPLMDLLRTRFYELGRPVFWPGGKYYFLGPDTTAVPAGGTAVNLQNADRILNKFVPGLTHWFLDETEDRMQTGVGTSYFMGGRQEPPPYSRVTHTEVRFHGLTVWGKWSHVPGGEKDGPTGAGWCPFRFEGFAIEEFVDCTAYDIRNKPSRNAHNARVRHSNLKSIRCARGGWRTTDVGSGSIENIEGWHCADDLVDVNMTSEIGTDTTAALRVRGVFAFDCETAIAYNAGGRCNLTDWQAILSKGSAIGVVRAGAQSPGSGRGYKHAILLGNGLVQDPLEAVDLVTGELVDQDLASGAIQISGNESEGVAGKFGPWTYDPALGRRRLPWEQQAGSASPSSIMSAVETEPQGPGEHYTASEIHVVRALPDVTNYADWAAGGYTPGYVYGNGWMFTKNGWRNPPVPSTKRKATAVSLNFDMSNVDIGRVVVSGLRCAIALNASGSNVPERAFRRLRLHRWVVSQIETTAIYMPNPGVPVFWDIDFVDWDLDIDPGGVHAKRDGATGAWDAYTTWQDYDSSIALIHGNIEGVRFRRCRYANAAAIIRERRQDVIETLDHPHVQMIECEAAADITASNSGDAGNLGIRYVPACSAKGLRIANTHSAFDNDALFMMPKDPMPLEVSALTDVTAGKIARGMFICNRAPDPAVLTPAGDVVTGWVATADGDFSVSSAHMAPV